MAFLLRNAATNVVGEPLVLRDPDGAAGRFPRVVQGTVGVSGNFSGCTVTVQVQLSHGGPWYTPDGATFRAEGLGNLAVTCVAVRAMVTDLVPGDDVTVELVTPELAEG